MTITMPAMTCAGLKQVKNVVIGNPLAKLDLVMDPMFLPNLVGCLNPSTPTTSLGTASNDDLRTEAAHVVASLSYGSEEPLARLLQHDALPALIFALSRMNKSDPFSLRVAFVRALRAVVSASADIIGPSLWGLRKDSLVGKNEARSAIEGLFDLDSMDVWLSLLGGVNGGVSGGAGVGMGGGSTASSTSSVSAMQAQSVQMSIAQMISSVVRSSVYRHLVCEWMPPPERTRLGVSLGHGMAIAEHKSRRGWEKTAVGPPGGSVPWVITQLLMLLGTEETNSNFKLSEAMLYAIAALARDNPPVASVMVKTTCVPGETRDRTAWAVIMGFTKSRSVDVQLAACLCITHIIRAYNCLHPHGSNSHHAPPTPTSPTGAPVVGIEETGPRAVMSVVNRLLSLHSPIDILDEPSPSASSRNKLDNPHVKAKACFILYHLVMDDVALCHGAFERGCLDNVAALIKRLSPPEPAPIEWEEDEPEAVASLREAALTVLAALCLFDNDIRGRATDELGLLPCIARAMRAKRHVGTRYAAAQCVRSLSRAVSVLRANILDSGLGMDVLNVVLGKPLGTYVNVSGGQGSGGGSVPGRLVWKGKGKDVRKEESESPRDDGNGLVDGSKEDRRVIGAALSAVCNIVTDFSPLRPEYTKAKLSARLVFFLRDSDDHGLRLSAIWAIKNLVRKTSLHSKKDMMSHLTWDGLVQLLDDPDEDVMEQALNVVRNLAEDEEGTKMVFAEAGEKILARLPGALVSTNENIVLQAAYVLANLSNAPHEQQDLLISTPSLLPAIQKCIEINKAEVRRPAVSAVHELVKGDPRRRKGLFIDAGVLSTLRRLVEWSGHGPSAGGHGHSHSHSHAHPHAHSHGMSSSPIPIGTSSVGGWGRPQRRPSAGAASGPSVGGYGSSGGWASPGWTVPDGSALASSSAGPASPGSVSTPWGWSHPHPHHPHSHIHVHGHPHPHSLPHPPPLVHVPIGSQVNTHLPIHSHGSLGIIHGHGAYAMRESPIAFDDDRDVVYNARAAIDWLERGESFLAA